MTERSDYDLLSIDEVARTIGQSVKNLRRMIRFAEFPDGFPAPRKVKWRWSVVRDWVLEQEIRKRIAVKSGTNPGDSGTNDGSGQNRSSEAKKR